ncbi:MAG: homoserine kinase [Chitinophagales bacterium]
MKKITAFAPATVANMICGYDILGCAVDGIGDEVSVWLNGSPENKFELQSHQPELLQLPPEKNVAFAMVKMLQDAAGHRQGITVSLKKNMPLNSGMGSSSASTAAALVATNALLGQPFTTRQLLDFAIEGERLACGHAHADNVAPALMGGIVLIKSNDPLEVVSLPVPEHWHVALLHPEVDVPTRLARQILKQHIPLKTAVQQTGYLAGFIAGLYRRDDDLVKSSLHDVMVTPHRAALIPCFYEMREKALQQQALGFGISGSGPSVFALCTSEQQASSILLQLKDILANHRVSCSGLTSAIGQGARLI